MDGVTGFGIPYDDLTRARKFYQTAFGWHIAQLPDLVHFWAGTTESDPETMRPTKVGAINGGLVQRPYPEAKPILVLTVDSVDDSLRRIRELGGQVEMPKVQIAKYGFYAQITDTEGNSLGIWEDAVTK